MDYAPIVRIVLRYLVGAGFVSASYIAPDNPDIVYVASSLLGAAVEVTYYLAKRWGWKT